MLGDRCVEEMMEKLKQIERWKKSDNERQDGKWKENDRIEVWNLKI